MMANLYGWRLLPLDAHPELGNNAQLAALWALPGRKLSRAGAVGREALNAGARGWGGLMD